MTLDSLTYSPAQGQCSQNEPRKKPHSSLEKLGIGRVQGGVQGRTGIFTWTAGGWASSCRASIASSRGAGKEAIICFPNQAVFCRMLYGIYWTMFSRTYPPHHDVNSSYILS